MCQESLIKVRFIDYQIFYIQVKNEINFKRDFPETLFFCAIGIINKTLIVFKNSRGILFLESILYHMTHNPHFLINFYLSFLNEKCFFLSV